MPTTEGKPLFKADERPREQGYVQRLLNEHPAQDDDAVVLEQRLRQGHDLVARMEQDIGHFLLEHVGADGVLPQDARELFLKKRAALDEVKEHLGEVTHDYDPALKEVDPTSKLVFLAEELNSLHKAAVEEFRAKQHTYRLGHLSPKEYGAMFADEWLPLIDETEEAIKNAGATGRVDREIVDHAVAHLKESLGPRHVQWKEGEPLPQEFLEYRTFLGEQISLRAERYDDMLQEYHDGKATRGAVEKVRRENKRFFDDEMQRIGDDPWDLGRTHPELLSVRETLIKGLMPVESTGYAIDRRGVERLATETAYIKSIADLEKEVDTIANAIAWQEKEKGSARSEDEHEENRARARKLFEGELFDIERRLEELDRAYAARNIVPARRLERIELGTRIESLRAQYGISWRPDESVTSPLPKFTVPSEPEEAAPVTAPHKIIKIRALHRQVRAQYASVQHTLTVDQRRVVRAKLATFSGLVRQAEDNAWRELFTPIAAVDAHPQVFAAMVHARQVAPTITAVVAPHFKLTY